MHSMREIVNWIGELLNIFVHSMIAAPIYKMIVTGSLLKTTGFMCYFGTLLFFIYFICLMLCSIDYNMKEVLFKFCQSNEAEVYSPEILTSIHTTKVPCTVIYNMFYTYLVVLCVLCT